MRSVPLASAVRTPSWSRTLAALLAAATTTIALPAMAEPDAAPPRPRQAPPPGADTYAVVIGYNGGGAGLPVLRFADDDAVRFALFFAGLDAPDRPSRVWLLADLDAETTGGLDRAGLTAPARRSPTRVAVFAALAEVGRALALRPRRDRPATLYVLYAGHGLKGRILLKPEEAPEAAITGREIRAAVAELARIAPALRTYLFFDACRSQSLFTDRGGDPELGPDLGAEASALEARANAVAIGVLTAASSGKPAGEIADLGAGYFSHVLASGLAGAADADGDDVVSFGELAAFVAFNTLRLTGQRPWFSPPGGDMNAPALDHRGRRTRIDLSSSSSGRYLIEAVPGRPVFAEAWKGDRRPLRLTLPPGRYSVLHAATGNRASRAEITLAAGAPSDLSGATWTDAADDGAAARPRGAQADVDQEGAATGDVATLAFAAAFTTDVVSTLTAGYDAGRTPPAPLGGARNAIAVGFALGEAPLGLGGAEFEASLRYRRLLGRTWFSEASVRAARSSHTASEAYTLDRVTALVGGGGCLLLGGWGELSASLGVGGGPVLRRGNRVTGDSFAPAAALRAAVAVNLGSGWGAYAGGGVVVQGIRVDGGRQASTDPSGEIGVALAF